MNRTLQAILGVLERNQDKVLGSTEIARALRPCGIDLTERAVRYHLQILDERGLTKVFGKKGRRITERGIEEHGASLVSERVGFVISRMETLSCKMNFDIETGNGDVVLNISCLPKPRLKEAIRILSPVFESPFVISDRLAFFDEGTKVGDYFVPEGMVGFGTVCSVTVNGIFLKAGVPVASKFGGVLETNGDGPSRFVALISYEGSSLDPLVVFIKSGMTDVLSAISGDGGRVLASFREIPVVSAGRGRDLARNLREKGIMNGLIIGGPNQQLLEMPVAADKAGLVVVGGLNPAAALEESGIPVESKAMAFLYDYANLEPFGEAVRRLGMA